MFKYRKVGGLRFLRIGRLQLSWCVVRKAAPALARKAALVREVPAGWRYVDA